MNRSLIGILTPSSNTILEPATAAMLAGFEDVSAHFARFRVTQIALSADSDAQFEFEPMLAAAELLADAKVDVIGWSGTSASWLGFARDDILCRAIEERTGIRTCTSVRALNELLATAGARRIALVTPYSADVQRRIAANYAEAGLQVVAERHVGLSDNFSFALIGADEVRRMCREVAEEARPDAILILCTNMHGSDLMRELEAELGTAVLDSTAAVVWKALDLLGRVEAPVRYLGSMFSGRVPGDS